MGGVMQRVPGVGGQSLIQIGAAMLGMSESASSEVSLGDGFNQDNPTGMKRTQNVERYLYMNGFGVGKLGPCGLVVGLDDGPVLGKSHAQTAVRLHVAVCKMMHNLTDIPSTFAIRSLNLLAGKAFQRCSQGIGQIAQGLHGLGSLGWGQAGGAMETANRIAEIFVCSYAHGSKVSTRAALSANGIRKNEGKAHSSKSRSGHPESLELSSVMVVMMMMVMVCAFGISAAAKGKTGTDEDEEECNSLFHVYH